MIINGNFIVRSRYCSQNTLLASTRVTLYRCPLHQIQWVRAPNSLFGSLKSLEISRWREFRGLNNGKQLLTGGRLLLFVCFSYSLIFHKANKAKKKNMLKNIQQNMLQNSTRKYSNKISRRINNKFRK